MADRTPYDEPIREGDTLVRECKTALEKARADEATAKRELDTVGDGLEAWSPEYRVRKHEAREAWRTAHEKAEAALQAWKDARREARSLRSARARWKRDEEARRAG